MAQQKASFKKWWKNITGNKAAKVGLFSVDLVDSIVYAGVPVHKTVDGHLRIQGYIPTIVSKCGWFLKENGLKTRGIFRVSGSAKRIADLQTLFDTPPLYGSQLDWSPYTIHDASSVLRRYLNSLPDPVITLEYYEKFRDINRTITDDKEKIVAYQDLMAKLPPPHSCLLMYLLDFLAMFSYHSDENLMTSKNLASVFQPGILSHPDHAMSPGDYMASASVVEFLIENQSSFALPTPNFDEDEDEGASFGVANSVREYAPESGSIAPTSLPKLPIAQGYVNADDHGRVRQLMGSDTGNETSSTEEHGEPSLDRSKSDVRRQLSLRKATGGQMEQPGQRPMRSKSTSSSTSSQHGQSRLISSNFLGRRRSSRVSKTQSIHSTNGVDIDDVPAVVPAVTASGTEVAAQDASFSSLSPKHLSLRKAQTFPRNLQTLDGDDTEDAAIRTKRAVPREPSIIFETIDLQFPIPSIPDLTPSADSAPSTTPKDAANKPGDDSTSTSIAVPPPVDIHSFDSATKPAIEWGVRDRLAAMEPTAHIHIPDPPLPQPDNLSHQRPTARDDAAHQRILAMGITATNVPVPGKTPVVLSPGGKRPQHRNDGPIQRTKSTPAGLTKSSGSHRAKNGHDNQSHQSSSHSILKGWLSGRNKDRPNKENEGGAGTKEDKKREPGVPDKQRKYRSQDISLTLPAEESHLVGNTHNKRDSGRGDSGGSTLWQGGFLGREPIQEAAETGHDEPRRQQINPPPRPKPPPPEGSLMDLLEPRQLASFGSSHSGSTTPSDSRSASPAPYNRLPQHSPVQPPHSHSPSPPSSIHNKSRSNSTAGQHGDHHHTQQPYHHHHRPRHGARLPSHGSLASVNSHGSGMMSAVLGGGDQHVHLPQMTPRRGESPLAPPTSGLYHFSQSPGSSPNLSLHDQARMSGHSSDFTEYASSSSATLINTIPTPAKSRDRKASIPYAPALGSSSPSNRSRNNSFRTASPSRVQQSPSGSPRLAPGSLPAPPQSSPPPTPLSRSESGHVTPEGGMSPGRPQPPARRGTAPHSSSHHGHNAHHHSLHQGSPHFQSHHNLLHHSPLAGVVDDDNLSRQRSGSGSGVRPTGYQPPLNRAKSRERQRDLEREREKERDREEEDFRLARSRSAAGGSYPALQPGDPPGFF